MTDMKRLGLGCMGMNMSNRERSVETVRYALDHGVTMFNTGEFYGGGESEMVLREALKGVPRDKYFLSVKFGVLPQPGGGIYGLDVKPFNVKAHLAYSMHRLGLDYIDLYQPARMDESVPVEELMGALADLVKEGYIGSIGLTELTPENLDRAAKVHPIRMAEFSYSLANRDIETNGILETARKNKIDVLAFSVLNHGLLADTPAVPGRPGFPQLQLPEDRGDPRRRDEDWTVGVLWLHFLKVRHDSRQRKGNRSGSIRVLYWIEGMADFLKSSFFQTRRKRFVD